jgi:predicted nucleic acid-binding protein
MPSSSIFLDTSGWLALLNEDDALHRLATERWLEIGERNPWVFLTDWIVAETGNGLARTAARTSFSESVRRLRGWPPVRFVQVTPGLRDQAVETYSARRDKTWGLVDCASFLVMSEHGILEAFTNDRHFEQAGFTCLLPASGD